MLHDTVRARVNDEQAEDAALLEMTINDLVTQVPEAMGVLAPLGIDLCCGGSLPLGTALDHHGIPRESVVREISRLADDRVDMAKA